MPEFRKWILASAAVTLFAGLASAQVSTGGTTGNASLTCTTQNGSVTPSLRAEGYTELMGDIVIVCTGGTPPALGATIPTANITIFLNTAVTSRLLPTSAAPNASEALLLIDEPGSGLGGYGPSVPQTLCSTPAVGAGAGGCVQTVGTIGVNTGVPVLASAPTTPGPNVFQGVVGGNQVTFFGIPVLPPSTAGASRVLRITNVRANANGVTAGGPTPGTVVASISTSPASSLPISNPTLTTGFVQPGLNTAGTTLRNAQNTGAGSGNGTTFNQCQSVSVGSSQATSALGLLQFQENFATAFKVRTQGIQNIPGTLYNSESGFQGAASATVPGTGATFQAGLADYGTRLKATFSNVPSGVSLFVSTRDVVNSFATPTGNAQAVLVVSETAVDGPGGPPVVNQTAVFTSGSNTVGIAPVPIGTGSGNAVWEIISTNPAQIDSVLFSVFINYTASPATNVPAAPSTISVTFSFAPTPLGGSFTAATGAAASSGLTIPRFSDSLNTTKNLANFAICTTALLYPYVINTGGFDTGIAIANTTTDPFGTTPQSGTCSLTFYGSSAPTTPVPPTPTVATGTVYANLASTLAPGFSGYMIAVCNFQFAHGFAFVSDVGARNLAMGYLALVIPSTPRAAAEALNN